MKRVITITIEQEFEKFYEEIAIKQMNDEGWINGAKETIEDSVFFEIVGEPIDGIETAVAVNIAILEREGEEVT